MREFFHGWRRKAGCIALVMVMALALMGMWIRSRVVGDRFYFGRSGRVYHFLASFQSGVKWVTSNDPKQSLNFPRYVVSVTDRSHTDETLLPVFGESVIKWRWHRCGLGFHFGAGTEGGWQFTVAIIPYWSVTIPLTLLSAYLILWTPRKQQPAASNPHA